MSALDGSGDDSSDADTDDGSTTSTDSSDSDYDSDSDEDTDSDSDSESTSIYETVTAENADEQMSLALSLIDITSQNQNVQDQITTLQDQQAQKEQDLQDARDAAYTAFENADPFLRGRLGIITNNSTVAYQLLDGQGNVLDTILASGTSSRQFALSDYANDQQGSMFTLVPYDATTQVQQGTDEAMLNGGSLVILCNTNGANQEGNAYGYGGAISISQYIRQKQQEHILLILIH